VQSRVEPPLHNRRADAGLDRALADLPAKRGPTKTVCPSEVARAVGGDDRRDLMEPARAATRPAVSRGAAEVTPGGRVVDPSTAKGPVRIRRTRRRPRTGD
jgi:hypothetical protein